MSYATGYLAAGAKSASAGGVGEAVERVEPRRSLVFPALISLGVALLTACAEQPPPPPAQTVVIKPPTVPPPPPPPAKPERVFPLPARKPTPTPENVANAPDTSTSATTLAIPEPEAPAITARQLIGLDQPAASRLLGAATEQGESPPASIWRYRNATCELDLFFYLDLRSGKMRTLHYVFKGDHSGKDDCLRSLAAARGS